MFFVGLTNLSSFTNANSLSCISMNNQERKTRLQVVDVNGDESVLFPFSIKTSKCSGSCKILLTIRIQKFVFLIWYKI